MRYFGVSVYYESLRHSSQGGIKLPKNHLTSIRKKSFMRAGLKKTKACAVLGLDWRLSPPPVPAKETILERFRGYISGKSRSSLHCFDLLGRYKDA